MCVFVCVCVCVCVRARARACVSCVDGCVKHVFHPLTSFNPAHLPHDCGFRCLHYQYETGIWNRVFSFLKKKIPTAAACLQERSSVLTQKGTE